MPSCSTICPFIKNIKSFSVVDVMPDGAEAVIAVKLDVAEFINEPVCVKHFLKYI